MASLSVHCHRYARSLATLDRKNPRKTREILRLPAKSLGNLRNLRKIAQFRQNRSTLPLTASTLVGPRCWRPAGTLHQPSALAYCECLANTPFCSPDACAGDSGCDSIWQATLQTPVFWLCLAVLGRRAWQAKELTYETAAGFRLQSVTGGWWVFTANFVKP